MVRPCRVRLDTSGYRSSATRQASITCVPSTVCSTCRGRAFLFCIGLSRLHPWPDVGGVFADFWTSTTRPFHPPALGHLPRCSPHASAAPTVCASTRRGRAFLFCIGLSRLHPWPDVGGVFSDFLGFTQTLSLCFVCVCVFAEWGLDLTGQSSSLSGKPSTSVVDGAPQHRHRNGNTSRPWPSVCDAKMAVTRDRWFHSSATRLRSCTTVWHSVRALSASGKSRPPPGTFRVNSCFRVRHTYGCEDKLSTCCK